MKSILSLLALSVVLFGCSQQTENTEQKTKTVINDFTWSVKIDPLEGNNYILSIMFIPNSRDLNPNMNQEKVSFVGFPSIEISPSSPFEGQVPKNTNNPDLKIEAALNWQDRHLILTYRAMVNKDGKIHRTTGSVPVK